MDHKKSVERALSAYCAKQIKKTGPKRKNKSPEKDVEQECVAWMRAKNWDVQIYSAKATYNPRLGRYMGGSMKAGTVDCQGVMPSGIFVAVEFKSPGNIKAFNLPKNCRQKEYLKEKIKNNAFGACVDSVKLLQLIFETWEKIEDRDQKRAYLFSKLP